MTEPGPASPRTAATPSRARALWARASAAALAVGPAPALLVLAFVVPLPVEGGRSLLGLPSLCLFRSATGIPCPGCGMTRSLVCLAHGHLADAVRFHPLGPVVFLWLAGTTLLRLLPARTRATLLAAVPPRLGAGAAVALAVLLFGVWAVRLAGGLPWPP